MTDSAIILTISGAYIVALAVISVLVRKHSQSSEDFTSGGKAFPAIFIGFLMASEFIGTSASLGTAQGAYEYGISAAWNLVALGVGFILFSFFLAHRYKAMGENTISGVLKRGYGENVRVATSVIMIIALLTVAVAVYAGGGAIFSSLLGMDKITATILTGVLSVLYVAVGGMRSVVYTNVLHAGVMLVGIVLAAMLPLNRVGGFGALQDALPASFFSWDAVGWGQIFAWMIAGAGATFATQYIVQAITSVPDERTAKRASIYSSLLLIPYGLLSALAGMCAAVLFPHITSLEALPTLVVNMNAFTAGIVISGLAAALFGTISAITLAVSTLLLKDFYRPLFNPTGDDRKNLRFVRLATVLAGIVPMLLALYASDVLAVTFLGKALRSALAVLVLMLFYSPRFGTRSGALVSIIASLVLTVAWFLAGNPFGIDNAYVAILTPIVIMSVSHVTHGTRPPAEEPRDQVAGAAR
jgi:SSS family solute:Na+ symporter